MFQSDFFWYRIGNTSRRATVVANASAGGFLCHFAWGSRWLELKGLNFATFTPKSRFQFSGRVRTGVSPNKGAFVNKILM